MIRFLLWCKRSISGNLFSKSVSNQLGDSHLLVYLFPLLTFSVCWDRNGLCSSVVTRRRWLEEVESSPPGPASQCERSARPPPWPSADTRAHRRNATPQYDLKEMKCHTWGMLGTRRSGGEVTTGHVRCVLLLLLLWSCRAFSLRQTDEFYRCRIIHDVFCVRLLTSEVLLCGWIQWNSIIFLPNTMKSDPPTGLLVFCNNRTSQLINGRMSSSNICNTFLYYSPAS